MSKIQQLLFLMWLSGCTVSETAGIANMPVLQIQQLFNHWGMECVMYTQLRNAVRVNEELRIIGEKYRV